MPVGNPAPVNAGLTVTFSRDVVRVTASSVEFIVHCGMLATHPPGNI